MADLDRDASLPLLVQHAIVASVERIVSHDAGVRLGEDPEHLHQFRVGARRLRPDLRTFAGVLDSAWVMVLCDELRWLGARAGVVRDRDVLAERVRGGAMHVPIRFASDVVTRRWSTLRAPLPGSPSLEGSWSSSRRIGRLAAPRLAATCHAVISLIAASGLRLGETLALDRADVDLDAALLTVVGKNQHTRLVPLHPTTAEMLARYAARRDLLCPVATSASFFLTTTGRRPLPRGLQQTFAKLVVLAEIQTPPGRRHPRITTSATLSRSTR